MLLIRLATFPVFCLATLLWPHGTPWIRSILRRLCLSIFIYLNIRACHSAPLRGWTFLLLKRHSHFCRNPCVQDSAAGRRAYYVCGVDRDILLLLGCRSLSQLPSSSICILKRRHISVRSGSGAAWGRRRLLNFARRNASLSTDGAAECGSRRRRRKRCRRAAAKPWTDLKFHFSFANVSRYLMR